MTLSCNNTTYSYNFQSPAPEANPALGITTGSCGGYFWNCGVSLSGASLAALEAPAGTIAVTEGSSGLVRFGTQTSGSIIKLPTEAELESNGTCTTTGGGAYFSSECLRARHFGTMNTLFADGHVKAMPWKTILGSDNDPNVVRYWTTAANPLLQ